MRFVIAFFVGWGIRDLFERVSSRVLKGHNMAVHNERTDVQHKGTVTE